MRNPEPPTAEPEDDLVADGVLPRPPLDSFQELFGWYSHHLCCAELRDPRGYRICFGENEFIHLAKITDRFNQEPKNKKLAIDQIRRGRFPTQHGENPNYDPERVRNLMYAAALAQRPDFIVPNWQVEGRAYPGEVFVRNFGGAKRKYRTLVCLIQGTRRVPVTMFPKQSITHMKDLTRLWP